MITKDNNKEVSKKHLEDWVCSNSNASQEIFKSFEQKEKSYLPQEIGEKIDNALQGLPMKIKG